MKTLQLALVVVALLGSSYADDVSDLDACFTACGTATQTGLINISDPATQAATGYEMYPSAYCVYGDNIDSTGLLFDPSTFTRPSECEDLSTKFIANTCLADCSTLVDAETAGVIALESCYDTCVTTVYGADAPEKKEVQSANVLSFGLLLVLALFLAY